MKIIFTKTKLRKSLICIGLNLTENVPELLRKNFSDAEKVILVTNDKIISIYENRIKDFLGSCGFEYKIIVIKDGEKYKSIKSADYIYSRLIDFNVHRNDAIIAFGGGVIGDLAGFAASTYNRGVKLIQYPTTIIGQVDSSIGGKVVINYNNVKNMIGCFYQPHMVIVDPALIYTLDESQIINGLAEVVKYGIIFDRKILEIISSSIDYNKNDRLLSLIKSDVFENVIYRCCSIKSRVVEKDEFDLGYRNLLNFGHTIGHCIENASNLKNINHGQAVGMGMIVAIDISISLGLAKVQLKDNILKLYKRLKLPYIIPRLSIEKIMSALKYDKKFTSKKNKFVLIKGVNRPIFYYDVNSAIIIKSIEKNMIND